MNMIINRDIPFFITGNKPFHYFKFHFVPDYKDPIKKDALILINTTCIPDTTKIKTLLIREGFKLTEVEHAQDYLPEHEVLINPVEMKTFPDTAPTLEVLVLKEDYFRFLEIMKNIPDFKTNWVNNHNTYIVK